MDTDNLGLVYWRVHNRLFQTEQMARVWAISVSSKGSPMVIEKVFITVKERTELKSIA